MESQLNPSEAQALHKFLRDRFSLEELKDLAYVIGIDYENISRDTKSSFARELLMACERRDLLGELVYEVIRQRNDSVLLPIAAQLLPRSPRTKVQLIVRGMKDDIPDKEHLKQTIAMALLADGYSVNAEEIEIIAGAKGSLHVLISIPTKQIEALILLPKPVRLIDGYLITQITPYQALLPQAKSNWQTIAADPEWPPKLNWTRPKIEPYNRLSAYISAIKVFFGAFTDEDWLYFALIMITAIVSIIALLIFTNNFRSYFSFSFSIR